MTFPTTEMKFGTIYQGHVYKVLKSLPDESVHCCVTSPPYYKLRDYGMAKWKGGDSACDHIERTTAQCHASSTLGPNRDGLTPNNAAFKALEKQFTGRCGKCGALRQDRQIGHEATPELYVDHLVKVFREVRRVLRGDGTFWLNIGDTYFNPAKHPKGYGESVGLKQKDLIGIPWMLAFALRTDGWFLRQECIWHKPDPMPEPSRNRCVRSHEQLFLLTKQPSKYYFDYVAIQERGTGRDPGNKTHKYSDNVGYAKDGPGHTGLKNIEAREMSNRRSVWKIGKVGFKGSHFAAFPPRLPELCITAGTSEEGVCSNCGSPNIRQVESVRRKTRKGERHGYNGKVKGDTAVEGIRDPDRHVISTKTIGWEPSCQCGVSFIPATVLDPFFGAGTTGMVAQRLRRRFIGIEINPEYVAMAEKRISRDFKQTLWDCVE